MLCAVANHEGTPQVSEVAVAPGETNATKVRGIYHCSRMISAQYGTEFIHSEYQKIKKVYSIFVCMTPPKKRQNSITRYHLVEENLIGNVKEPVRNYDLLKEYETVKAKLYDVIRGKSSLPESVLTEMEG